MIKDQIINQFKTLLPIEQMEICIELQLIVLENTGADKDNPILKETLEDTLRSLKHG